MSKIILLILVVVLLYQSSATSLGVSLVGPLTKTAFSCLKQQGYTRAMIRAFEISTFPGAIDTNATQTLINAKAAGLVTSIYVVLCRTTDPAAIRHQLIDVFNGIDFHLYNWAWLKVEPNTTPGCTWEGYTQIENCNFILTCINVWVSFGIPVGVFTTYNIWEKYIGSTCPTAGLRTFYVWYADYTTTGHVNTTQSFDDFKPFGGWGYPWLKQIGGNITVKLCNNTNWHAFVDETWGLVA